VGTGTALAPPLALGEAPGVQGREDRGGTLVDIRSTYGPGMGVLVLGPLRCPASGRSAGRGSELGLGSCALVWAFVRGLVWFLSGCSP